MSGSQQKISQQKLFIRHTEEVSLVLSPKTLFESLNLVKSYEKTNLTVFTQVGLNFFGQYTYSVQGEKTFS